MKLVDRKISLNRTNVIGLNLERYNDLKPNKEVKRMITNLFLEYNESEMLNIVQTSTLTFKSELTYRLSSS